MLNQTTIVRSIILAN